ncbi:SRPBCC family protein [Rubrivirga sp. IMCC43871]|uniref:SRPBCC family protein n=1 Tax=Rubrivirga sp. IMCC43871 TaxID=3391575 RepID=UPI00398FBC28
MITVETSIERALNLPVSVEEAWAFLTDVPRWGALFPHVEAVRPYPEGGDNAYWWTMEPLGPPGARVVVEYACRYHPDAEALTMRWEPVPGTGNAQFGGSSTIGSDGNGGTTGTLRVDAVLDIGVPRLFRAIVRPTVEFEMGRMTDLFVSRLEAEAEL